MGRDLQLSYAMRPESRRAGRCVFPLMVQALATGLLVFARVLAPIVRLLTTPGIVLPGARAAPHPVHLVQLALRLGVALLHESLPCPTHVVCGFSRRPDRTHVLLLRQRPCRDCDRRSRDREHATRRGVASLLRPAFRLVAHCAACNSYREGFASPRVFSTAEMRTTWAHLLLPQ